MSRGSVLQTKTKIEIVPNQNEMLAIPQKILDSRLMRCGGYDVFDGIIDETIKHGLINEAAKQQEFIIDNFVNERDTEEVRGGAPKRKFLSSPGGIYQERFYKSDWLISFLRNLTTPHLRPTGEQGTYTYYSRNGDYLDIHRDIVDCDVAVISCLVNEHKKKGKLGGHLCLYPDRKNELLSDVRANPEKGAVKLMLEENQTIVFYGGYIPHRLLPVLEGQNRVVSVLCYRAF